MTVTTDKNTEEGQPTAEETTAGESTAAEAAEEAAADDPQTPDEAGESPDTVAAGDGKPAPGRRGRIVAAAVIAVFVALVALSGFLGWQLWQQREVAQAGEQARQQATEYAEVLTSIDSAKVDENFDAVLDGATGEFKDMYSQSSEQLRQLLIDNKATAHGVVVESAVQSATKDKVVVLLFVDQSVTNTNVPDPRMDRSRIKMTMEYVDGRWRASKVELP